MVGADGGFFFWICMLRMGVIRIKMWIRIGIIGLSSFLLFLFSFFFFLDKHLKTPGSKAPHITASSSLRSVYTSMQSSIIDTRDHHTIFPARSFGKYYLTVYLITSVHPHASPANLQLQDRIAVNT